MWSPPKFATAFPKSSRCQIPKHKRHRNSLLVGLQRSPLSGPSSFLGNNLLGISIFQGQSRFYVQSKFFVMATKCTYVLNPIRKFNRQIQSRNSIGVFRFTHIKLLKNWQVGTEIDGCAFAREAIGVIWTVFTTQIEVFDHKTWHITSLFGKLIVHNRYFLHQLAKNPVIWKRLLKHSPFIFIKTT